MGSIDLLRLLAKGSLRTIRIDVDNFVRPPISVKWLILSAQVNHITGSTSYLFIAPYPGIPIETTTQRMVYFSNNFAFMRKVDDTQASGWYNLEIAKDLFVVVDSDYALYFNGGAGAYVVLTVWEAVV